MIISYYMILLLPNFTKIATKTLFLVYNNVMSNVYVSCEADQALKKYLKESGHKVCEVRPTVKMDPAISTHPDIYMCALRDSVYHGERFLLNPYYPAHAIFNGCSTGKYFIHNLKYTAPDLLKAVRREGQIEVHVAQGYAKCSCVVVDEDSIITADRGIWREAVKAGMNVLLIEKSQVILRGYPYGFLGGASGKVGSTMIFNGDITRHSDYARIRDFIESRGLDIVCFKEYRLTDIGSIIEEKDG